MLQAGTKAPQFALPDQNGATVALKDFLGQKVVVYFYSRDNSGGCTRQAQGYAALHGEFQKLGVAVIGISKDTTASHAKFTAKYELPFTLLSDPELTAIKAYDVWQEKKMYGKVSFGVVRSSFIIDEKGTLLKVSSKVKPDTDAQKALDFIKTL